MMYGRTVLVFLISVANCDDAYMHYDYNGGSVSSESSFEGEIGTSFEGEIGTSLEGEIGSSFEGEIGSSEFDTSAEASSEEGEGGGGGNGVGGFDDYTGSGAPCASSPALRIVGGEEVKPNELSFMVSIHSGSSHVCGGSLVAPGWVLTAAHCGIQAGDTVKIGAHSTVVDPKDQCVESITVKQVYSHEKYNDRTTANDIALLRLVSSSVYAPLTLNYDASLEKKGKLTVSGWGLEAQNAGDLSKVLQKVQVPVVDKKVCNRNYDGDIVAGMMCAGVGGKDSCQGDSGGPLFARSGDNFVQVGIVSWGEGCAKPNRPGVYSSVSYFAKWIESKMSTF